MKDAEFEVFEEEVGELTDEHKIRLLRRFLGKRDEEIVELKKELANARSYEDRLESTLTRLQDLIREVI